MKIIIRVNPAISQTANDWVKNKFDSVKICHTSLLNVGAKNYESYFMLDNCPTEYHDYFAKFGLVMDLNIQNKRQTVAEMLKLGKELNDDILFLEDDYLWRPNFDLGQIKFDIDNFGVITPYDHPSHYFDKRESWQFDVFGFGLYRDCKTSTHTFAVKKEILNKHFYEFNFGQHDWIMWMRLRQSGVNLHSPVPGYAMHLAKDAVPLGFNYYKYYQTLKGNLNE